MESRETSQGTQITTFTAGSRVSVLLPLPLAGCYDYLVPEHMSLKTGDFVMVPLGSRKSHGVVWGEGSDDIATLKIKAVISVMDTQSLPQTSQRFVDWVARYTLSPPGRVLKMVTSVPDALLPPKSVLAYQLSSSLPDFKTTKARARVMDVLQQGPPRLPTELAREAGVGTSVVKGLVELGVLEALSLQSQDNVANQPDPDTVGPTLSDAQLNAADQLCKAVKSKAFSVFVIDGVPGSGKTEVYFEAIAKALRQGQQALVLLPEIALGAQWRKRFKARFGCLPLEWHSELTPATRRDTWRRVSKGGPMVIVGARSALFLPYPDLGLIVADEEHDAAYKQEEGVIYNGRDMAVVRARIGNTPIALASATPSLETVVNLREGKYTSLHLPERHGGALLPTVALINMCDEPLPNGRWISKTLINALTKTLEAGDQAMLYLNRRGYAPLTLCRGCGYRLQCPNCTAWLVEHRRRGRLQCHHCGHSPPVPKNCPECEAEDKFAACGPGVERLAEELEMLFPDVRYTIAASDTLVSSKAAEELVHSIENNHVDVIIGTQIVAKGYHFPRLTLVGVIDADLGLSGGDLRAAERTYQLLYQVAGRAGREQRPGHVIMQTYLPEHPVMQAMVSENRDAFINTEIKARKISSMPPFGRLAALIVSSKDERAADASAAHLSRNAPHGEGISVFGPAPAPISMLRGRHRRRLLLKTRKDIPVQSILKKWISHTDIPRTVRVQIDIDPYSFL